jgi:hypothetical protein
MATRKPGYQDTDTNRNKRQNRYGNSGADNDVDYRLDASGPPNNNKNRNRFINMPVTP